MKKVEYGQLISQYREVKPPDRFIENQALGCILVLALAMPWFLGVFDNSAFFYIAPIAISFVIYRCTFLFKCSLCKNYYSKFRDVKDFGRVYFVCDRCATFFESKESDM